MKKQQVKKQKPSTGADQQTTLTAMQVLLAARVPVVLWGDPGTGKTETISRLATSEGWHVEVVMASVHEPTDIGGLPVLSKSGVILEPPLWAKRVAAHDGTSLVFFDEVNTAAPATQNALMHVILTSHVGQFSLGRNVVFMAAANPPEQNAGAWDLSAPLANRFAHLRWPVEFEAWRSGYLRGWPTPRSIAVASPSGDRRSFFRAMQTSFLARRPGMLCKVPDDDTAASMGWPSPRTWERLADCLAIGKAAHASDSVIALVAESLVGPETATEFLAFMRDLDLPDPEALLTDPSSLVLPERTDQQFACLEAVTAAVHANTTARRWQNGFLVCIEAARQKAPDIAASAARELCLCRPANTHLPPGFEVFSDIIAAVSFEQADF